MADQVTELPRWASGVTAIYGLSGTGKSALGDTACEFVADRYGLTTMTIANDPGGWGNRRLSLIRAGVMQIYDPTNHVNYFETMEALSKGAFPAELLDADRGYAEPNVKLIMPRMLVWMRRCPQGHDVKRYDNQAVMLASVDSCPTCGTVVNVANQQTEQRMVKPAMFARVGLRMFDSITAMSDQGLQELARMSAQGELPVGGSGGSALGSADALRQGTFVAGTGSKAQVGFMQNRVYGWLTNIRAIPDQVIGAICTFGVEQSSGDDTRGGGEISYGLALAGTARTARAGGWVGTLGHATKEPDASGNMRHRLWLTNHVDPRDAFKRPYLAKHRGTPLGMPDFLEDPWSDDPRERERLANTVCSLGYFFGLLEQQFAEIARADAERFASFKQVAPAEEEVVSQVAATGPSAPAGGVAAGPVVTGGPRRLRRPGAVQAAPAMPAVAVAPPVIQADQSVLRQQLEASLVERAAVTAPPATNGGAGSPPVSATAGNSDGSPAAIGPVVAGPQVAPALPSTPVVPQRLRRVARPPIQ